MVGYLKLVLRFRINLLFNLRRKDLKRKVSGLPIVPTVEIYVAKEADRMGKVI
jgi:hypothetical protein